MSDIEQKGLFMSSTVNDNLMDGGGSLHCKVGNDSDVSYDPNYEPIARSIPNDSKDQEQETQRKYREQEGFVQKVYGIFLTQVFILGVYLAIVHVAKFYEKEEKIIMMIARNQYVLYASIVLAMIMLCLIITQMKSLQRKVPLNYIMGFTFSSCLTYICGYVTYTCNANTVLNAFTITLVLTMLMAKFGSKIVTKIGKKDQLQKALGPTFGILGSIVVLILLILMADPFKKLNKDAKTAGEADQKNNNLAMSVLFQIAMFTLVTIYLLMDTYAITNGKYDKMVSREDYIYGSTKLFADFVLMVTLLANLLQE